MLLAIVFVAVFKEGLHALWATIGFLGFAVALMIGAAHGMDTTGYIHSYFTGSAYDADQAGGDAGAEDQAEGDDCWRRVPDVRHQPQRQGEEKDEKPFRQNRYVDEDERRVDRV